MFALMLISGVGWAQTPGTTIPASTPPHIPVTGFRGEWNANSDYPTGSIVSFQGFAYIAKSDQSHKHPIKPDADSDGVTWYSLSGVYPVVAPPPLVPPPSPSPGQTYPCPSSPVTATTSINDPYQYTWGSAPWNGNLGSMGSVRCTVTGTLSTTGPLMTAWFQVFFPAGWVTNGTGYAGQDPFITLSGDNADYAYDVFLDTTLTIPTDCYGDLASNVSTLVTPAGVGVINLCGWVATPFNWVWVRVRAVTANPSNTPFTITFWE